MLGSIYSGYATPSEAAAVGVAATLVLIARDRPAELADLRATRSWARSDLGDGLLDPGRRRLPLDRDGLPARAAGPRRGDRRARAPPYGLIVILALFYIVLGLFLDGISITVMSLPITLPLVVQAGFDPFGSASSW